MEPNFTYKAKIYNIVDGDTVDAEVDLGFRLTARLRLRLLGVNTNEMTSPDSEKRVLAKEAKAFSFVYLMNKEVMISTKKSDAFGRYLADVFIKIGENWVNFNQMLIDNGLAVKFKPS